VLFAPYKRMAERLADWLAAVGDTLDDSVRLLITANPAEVPPSVAASPRLHFVGRLSLDQVQALWARATAVYYPTSVESFGYPLAEAQVNGLPVIALDTAQNREIAGPALCGYHRDDLESLRDATVEALAKQVVPHAAPFDADAYFDWLLGGNP
jgi:glycosyltransferase involved in cell wall biosynthesis